MDKYYAEEIDVGRPIRSLTVLVGVYAPQWSQYILPPLRRGSLSTPPLVSTARCSTFLAE